MASPRIMDDYKSVFGTATLEANELIQVLNAAVEFAKVEAFKCVSTPADSTPADSNADRTFATPQKVESCRTHGV